LDNKKNSSSIRTKAYCQEAVVEMILVCSGHPLAGRSTQGEVDTQEMNTIHPVTGHYPTKISPLPSRKLSKWLYRCADASIAGKTSRILGSTHANAIPLSGRFLFKEFQNIILPKDTKCYPLLGVFSQFLSSSIHLLCPQLSLMDESLRTACPL